MQLSEPCFTDPATAPDMLASRLTIPKLALAPGSRLYSIGMVVVKGNGTAARTDSELAVVRVLSGAAPTGKIRWAGLAGLAGLCNAMLVLVTAGNTVQVSRVAIVA